MNAPISTAEAGLSQDEAAERLRRFGPNALPEPRAPSLAAVFLTQFLSPPIYILLATGKGVGAPTLGPVGEAP